MYMTHALLESADEVFPVTRLDGGVQNGCADAVKAHHRERDGSVVSLYRVEFCMPQ